MSDEHADFLNGLHVVEYELERLIGELDEMQDRNSISTLDRVSLATLQWALGKLADDLHDANDEIRKARLEVASAKHEADTAWQQQQAEQLQSLSIFNGLRAELHTVKAERDSLQRQWDDLEKSVVQSTQPTMASVVQLVEAAKATAVQVTKKAGELPAQPAPEPYQWQVGDEIEDGFGVRRPVTGRNEKGWVFIEGNGGQVQLEWERCRWSLHRKASDVPPSPQQVAGFAAVTEPIDDSVGTDREGQP